MLARRHDHDFFSVFEVWGVAETVQMVPREAGDILPGMKVHMVLIAIQLECYSVLCQRLTARFVVHME